MSGNGKDATTGSGVTRSSVTRSSVTRSRAARPARDPDAADSDAQARALGLNTGWNVFSYLIAGMVAYGLIGWLIGRAVHVAILFPLGMLVGLGISIGYVIHHYGRQDLAGKGDHW